MSGARRRDSSLPPRNVSSSDYPRLRDAREGDAWAAAAADPDFRAEFADIAAAYAAADDKTWPR